MSAATEFPVDINERISYFSGWLIDKQEKDILSLRKAKKFLTASLVRELESKNLKKLSHYDIASTDLIYEANKELFNYVSMKMEEFVELTNGTVANINSMIARHNKSKVIRKFHVTCHCMTSIGGRRVYIAPLPSKHRSKVDMNLCIPQSRKSKDNSVFSQIIKIDTFNFTTRDFEILQEIDDFANSNKINIEEFVFHIYSVAIVKAGNHFNKNFHTNFGSLVKRFDPATIKEYSKRLNVPLFLLLNGRRLSFFANDEFLSNEDIHLVKEAFKNKNFTTLEKLLCPVFLQAIEESKFQEYLFRWIRICGFNVGKWKMKNETCPVESILSFRYKLDAIRQLIVLSAFAISTNVGVTAESYGTFEDDKFITNFKKLYTMVVKENYTDTKNKVSIDPEGKYVLVKGKILSFKMISIIKEELTISIEKCINDLTEWLSFGTPQRVYQKVFFSSSMNIDRENTDHTVISSIFDTIPQSTVEEFNIVWKNDIEANDENIKKKLLRLINEITKLLMFSIWISPGIALRFPELSILSFSGYDRNLFLDVVDRVFYFKTTYNKNKKYDSRLLFMDKVVTTHILWYLYILRPFTIELLDDKSTIFKTDMLKHNYIQEFSNDVEEDFLETPEAEEEEENTRELRFTAGTHTFEQMPANSTGDTILKMFLFVDVLHYGLISSTSFSSTLMSFPKDQSYYKHHKLRTFRQGLVALWKHFIVPEGLLMNEHSTMLSYCFGHNIKTHNNNYGVDKSRHIDHIYECDLDYYHAKKLCQKFQEITNYCSIKRDSANNEEHRPLAEEVVTDTALFDIWDVFEEGKKLYGKNFKFLSATQHNFTLNILLCNRKFLALQAPTAFGKTLTYVLPILTLHKVDPGHYIHFLAVPYEALKISSIKKLRSYNLIVEDINILKESEVNLKSKKVNVLVGCFDSFASRGIKETLANWENIFENVKRGYIIFDEAHVLWTEKKFRSRLSTIAGFEWEKYLKIIMISATLPRWLLDIITIERDISRRIVKEGRYINAIEEVPNKNIRTNVEWCEKTKFEEIVYNLIYRYLKNTEQGKGVFFFSSKSKMRNIYNKFFQDEDSVCMVDADVKEEVKTKIFEDFENTYSKTRIVMGTKLISNGLDCPSVNFVCLADCQVDPIDYLQMIGRIRKGGYVHIVAVENRRIPFQISELKTHLEDINWKECITKQISKFYNLQYMGHDLCCSNGTDNKLIEKVRISVLGKIVKRNNDNIVEMQGPLRKKMHTAFPLHINSYALVQYGQQNQNIRVDTSNNNSDADPADNNSQNSTKNLNAIEYPTTGIKSINATNSRSSVRDPKSLTITSPNTQISTSKNTSSFSISTSSDSSNILNIPIFKSSLPISTRTPRQRRCAHSTSTSSEVSATIDKPFASHSISSTPISSTISTTPSTVSQTTSPKNKTPESGSEFVASANNINPESIVSKLRLDRLSFRDVSKDPNLCKFLKNTKKGELVRDLKDYLNIERFDSIQKHLLGLDPRQFIQWHYEFPLSLCRKCMENKTNCSCHTDYGEVFGKLSAEILVLDLLLQPENKFINSVQNCLNMGSQRFVEIHSKDTLKTLYARFDGITKFNIIGVDKLIKSDGKRKLKILFQNAWKAIIKHRIDIIKLIFYNNIEENCKCYKKHRYFIDRCFQAHQTIQKDANTNYNSRIFLTQKRDFLLDLQCYIKKLCKVEQQKAIFKYINGKRNIQIIIFFLWCFFEERLHEKVLKNSIWVQGLCNLKAFPVFFKDMNKLVHFEFEECPLFVPVIAGWIRTNKKFLDWVLEVQKNL